MVEKENSVIAFPGVNTLRSSFRISTNSCERRANANSAKGSPRDDTSSRKEKKTLEKTRVSMRSSGADGRSQGTGDGLRKALDVGVVFGFDHNAGERLGARVAKNHAAIISKGGLCFL
jgi:hypothetical protein